MQSLLCEERSDEAISLPLLEITSLRSRSSPPLLEIASLRSRSHPACLCEERSDEAIYRMTCKVVCHSPPRLNFQNL
ncbi:MAG: hypothetical protein HPY76_08445 [Anaerolineae bacterium]|nr:hypothetical protein [Anaerolineae bacterium]